MCEHLAEALDLDWGLRKGVTLTGCWVLEAGGWLCPLPSRSRRPQIAMLTPHAAGSNFLCLLVTWRYWGA